MKEVLIKTAFIVSLCGMFPLCVVAQGPNGYRDQVIIDGNAGRNIQGAVGVNMASGDSNLQGNATAIAISNSNGLSIPQTSHVQIIDTGQFTPPDEAVTKIEGNAFNNAIGAIGINQSAGAANAQANSIAIGFGVEVTADTELAQSVSGIALPVASNGLVRETTVAESAFEGARGIVQVNQSAGVGNATGNSFSLRLQMGTP